MQEKPTLRERRESELDAMLDELIDCTDVVRVAKEQKFADLHIRLRELSELAYRAWVWAERIEDLKDFEKFGPEGGR